MGIFRQKTEQTPAPSRDKGAFQDRETDRRFVLAYSGNLSLVQPQPWAGLPARFLEEFVQEANARAGEQPFCFAIGRAPYVQVYFQGYRPPHTGIAPLDAALGNLPASARSYVPVRAKVYLLSSDSEVASAPDGMAFTRPAVELTLHGKIEQLIVCHPSRIVISPTGEITGG